MNLIRVIWMIALQISARPSSSCPVRQSNQWYGTGGVRGPKVRDTRP